MIDWSKDSLRFKDTRLRVEETNVTDLLTTVSIDPDNILTHDQKQVFRDTITDFTDVFKKQPGQYSGKVREVSNAITFSQPPPPNDKVYTPNYSEDLKCKWEKMDALEEDGVLRKPEELGVSVAYVSPSLLLPKTDPGDYRCVTEFSALNDKIIKNHSVSPSIPEAKRALAKKPFHIALDLSQYFYQSGVRAEDAQYLGVLHPYKGLRCYTKKPMGIKNASEE